MTMYEQLKAKIVKHCPELKLKGRQGCIKGSSCPDCGEELGRDGNTIFCPSCPLQFSDKSHLGHEPELRHILQVAFKSDCSLNISQLGELFEIKNGERKYGHLYDLTLPLKDQSPETLEWLNSIIE